MYSYVNSNLPCHGCGVASVGRGGEGRDTHGDIYFFNVHGFVKDSLGPILAPIILSGTVINTF